MRDHLIACLEEKKFSNFPYSINTMGIRENIFFACAGVSMTVKWFSAPVTPNGSFSLSREMYC